MNKTIKEIEDFDTFDIESFDENSNPMEKDILFWQMFEKLSELDPEAKPFLYFYTWEEPTLTLGKIQSNKNEIIKAAQALKIPYYERPTGGKAVLHGGDICYTFIARQNDENFGGTLKESFQKVSNLIKKKVSEVLKIKHLEEYLNDSPRDDFKANDNCFGSNAQFENYLLDQDQKHKVIGAAQKMGAKSFIQQGSIQFNKPQYEIEIFKNQKTISEIINAGKSYDLNDICLKLNE